MSVMSDFTNTNGNLEAALKGFDGVLTPDPAWADVPKHADEDIGDELDAQSLALTARTEFLKDYHDSLSANDGDKLIGQCPNVSILRSTEPTEDGQTIQLRQHTDGISHGGGRFRAVIDGASYTDDNGVIIKTSGGAAWLRLDADILSPLMFGCAGNANWSGSSTGVTDDTNGLKAAISAAAALGRPLCGAGEVYGVVTTLPMFASNTEISNLNIDVIRQSASPILEELFTFKGGASSAITVDFHHVKIDAHARVRHAVIFDGTRRCHIHHNTLLGIDAPNGYGIRVGIRNSGALNIGTKIYSNYVKLGVDPDNGTGSDTMNGVALFGNYVDPVIGDSGPDWSVQPTVIETEVYDNYIDGGTHNIHMYGTIYTDIHNNILKGGSHRNINLSRMSQRVHIHDNMMLEAGSSAVVFGYTRWVRIANNYIQSSSVSAVGSDDAAFQFGEWVEGLDIIGNTVRGDWVFGVHGECLRGGKISGNDITASWACIAIESQWTLTVPPLAKYTKSRNVPYKANTNTFDVDISNNLLHIGSAGVGIYLSAFNSKQMQRIILRGNQHIGGSIIDSVYTYEDSPGLIGNCHLLQHSAPGALPSSYFTNGVSAFSMIDSVTGLTTSETIIAASGDVSHLGATMFAMNGAYAVTNFLGYGDGAVISVRGLAGASLVNNSTKIRLMGSANASFTSGNEVVTLTRKNGIWFETARNF